MYKINDTMLDEVMGQLLESEKEYVRLRLQFPDYTQEQIAQIIGITPSALSILKHRPRVVKAMGYLCLMELKDYLPQYIRALRDKMASGDVRVLLQLIPLMLSTQEEEKEKEVHVVLDENTQNTIKELLTKYDR